MKNNKKIEDIELDQKDEQDLRKEFVEKFGKNKAAKEEKPIKKGYEQYL